MKIVAWIFYALALADFVLGTFLGVDITGVAWSPAAFGIVGVLFEYYSRASQSSDKEIKDGESTLTFVASWHHGFLKTGTGRLIIGSETAEFIADLEGDGLNTDGFVLNIQDIVGYKKGFMSFMTIELKNGDTFKLAVYKKDGVIQTLEERRVAYFTTRGLPVPPSVVQ